MKRYLTFFLILLQSSILWGIVDKPFEKIELKNGEVLKNVSITNIRPFGVTIRDEYSIRVIPIRHFPDNIRADIWKYIAERLMEDNPSLIPFAAKNPQANEALKKGKMRDIQIKALDVKGTPTRWNSDHVLYSWNVTLMNHADTEKTQTIIFRLFNKQNIVISESVISGEVIPANEKKSFSGSEIISSLKWKQTYSYKIVLK